MVLDLDLGVTESVLDAMSVRSKVAMHNLANQNTPGFKRYFVEFEDALRDAHNSGDSLSAVRPVVKQDTSGPVGVNNVSAMDELGLLNKVSMVNDVFSRRAAGYFNKLNKAIRGS